MQARKQQQQSKQVQTPGLKRRTTKASADFKQAPTQPKKKRRRRPIRPTKYDRFKQFMTKNGYDLKHLQEFEVHLLTDTDPEDKMPWGKYKGEDIMKLWTNLIDGGKQYLLWLYSQEISHIQLRTKLEELRQAEIKRTGKDPCQQSI